MRITDSMRYASTIQAEQGAASRLQTLSAQASSGTTINDPSDDPAVFSQVTALNGRLSILQARTTNNNDASGDLDLAGNILGSVNDKLVRAQEIAVQMADGSMDAGTRANAAIEVQTIHDSILAMANSRGATGYLFGGSATTTAPFDSTGSFVGNDTSLQVPISDGTTAPANASGAQAFTSAGGSDILTDLNNFAAALKGNNQTGITSAISQMTVDQRQVVAVQTQAGLDSDRLKTSSNVTTAAISNVQSQITNLTQGDTVALYSAFSAAQISYTRALTVSQQVLATIASQH